MKTSPTKGIHIALIPIRQTGGKTGTFVESYMQDPLDKLLLTEAAIPITVHPRHHFPGEGEIKGAAAGTGEGEEGAALLLGDQFRPVQLVSLAPE